MLEEIKIIKDAEKEAISKIEKASQESQKIVAEAEKKSANIIEETVAKANLMSDEMLKESRDKAMIEAEAIEKEMDLELEAFRSKAIGRIEKTKNMVVERIIG